MAIRQAIFKKADPETLLATERRRFARHEFVQPMVALIGRHEHDGYTYDISQGGLSFILAAVIEAGPATVELRSLGRRFQGRVLEPLPNRDGKTLRYRLEFNKLLSADLLKIMVG